MKISQSIIKDIIGEFGFCGYYLHRKHILNEQSEPTTPMLSGLLFEYLLLGATRDGETEPDYHKKVNGEMYKAEVDLRAMADNAIARMEKEKVSFDIVQPYYEMDNRSGHLDAIGTYKGKKYIIDVKWTGKSLQQWERDIKWGNTEHDFIVQGTHYQTLLKEHLPVLFVVFGASGWIRLYEIEYTRERIEEALKRVNLADSVMRDLDPRPSADPILCESCFLKDNCDKRNNSLIKITI